MSADGQAPTGELSGASQAPSSCALSRKCSTCGRAGHNSRTCLESRETTAAVIHDAGEPRAVEGTAPQQHAEEKSRRAEDDAPSEDSAGDSLREVRKKGVAWSEAEHKLFLQGLQKLGKGDWRGISRHYVLSRSPTQVASHAQKYYIRQSAAGKRKRRSSLFDLVPERYATEAGHGLRPPKTASVESSAAEKPKGGMQQASKQSFPGIMPGTEGAAMAFWYQMMLAQQNPMAWTAAMMGQGQQNANSSSQLPPMPTSAQNFLPQPFRQPGAPFGSGNGWDLPPALLNQAFTAFLIQQQQMANAAMMMMEPLYAAQGQGQQIALDDPSRSISGQQQQQSDSKPASATTSETGPGEGKETERSSTACKSEIAFPPKQTSSSGFGLTQAQTDHFGNGMLVRPKAHKAGPGDHYGEMPSYMLKAGEAVSSHTCGSAESQETGTRVFEKAAGLLHTPEASGLTHGT